MKILLIALFSSFLAAQTPGRGPTSAPPPDVSGTPVQPAQDIVIHVSSDLATALEKLRRTLLTDPVSDPKTGDVSRRARYATISDLVNELLTTGQGGGGIFRQVLRSFPSAGVKAIRDDAAKKAAEAKAAEDKAIRPTAK